MEEEGKNTPKKLICMSSHWIDTICVVLMFEILSSFSDWLSRVEAERRILEANAESRLTERQSGHQNEGMVRKGCTCCGSVLSLCQSVNLKRAAGCLRST